MSNELGGGAVGSLTSQSRLLLPSKSASAYATQFGQGIKLATGERVGPPPVPKKKAFLSKLVTSDKTRPLTSACITPTVKQDKADPSVSWHGMNDLVHTPSNHTDREEAINHSAILSALLNKLAGMEISPEAPTKGGDAVEIEKAKAHTATAEAEKAKAEAESAKQKAKGEEARARADGNAKEAAKIHQQTALQTAQFAKEQFTMDNTSRMVQNVFAKRNYHDKMNDQEVAAKDQDRAQARNTLLQGQNQILGVQIQTAGTQAQGYQTLGQIFSHLGGPSS